MDAAKLTKNCCATKHTAYSHELDSILLIFTIVYSGTDYTVSWAPPK